MKPMTASLRMLKQLRILKHATTILSINELSLNPAIWFGSMLQISLPHALRRSWIGNALVHTKSSSVLAYKRTNLRYLLQCAIFTMSSTFHSSILSSPRPCPLVYLHHLPHSMSKMVKNTLRSEIFLIPNVSIVISIISLNGKVSLIQRIHGNLLPTFLHAGSSRNSIVAILENLENLVIASLLLYCWINGYGLFSLFL